jgi:hypothetical protein
MAMKKKRPTPCRLGAKSPKREQNIPREDKHEYHHALRRLGKSGSGDFLKEALLTDFWCGALVVPENAGTDGD